MIRKILLISFLAVVTISSAWIQNLMLNLSTPALTQNIFSLHTAPALHEFAQAVFNGKPDQVVGVYVPGEMALPVGQQPNDNPAYVTSEPNRATQFAMASRYGTIGILAHNDLAGARFQEIKKNYTVAVIFGDGRIEYFVINEVQKYQALTPSSPLSDFVNLENPAEKLSAGQLFNRIYATGNRLVLQTCLSADGNSSWGRVFLIAQPLRSKIQARPFANTYLPDAQFQLVTSLLN